MSNVVVQITHHMNFAQIQKILTSPLGPVAKDMMRRGLKVETAAKRNLSSDPKRVNTGRLRASITRKMVMTTRGPAVQVGTNVSYAIYVHEGTGLYGPKAKMIRPVNKKVLRWKVKGGRGKKGYTYSMKSSGMRPNHFLKNALPAARG